MRTSACLWILVIGCGGEWNPLRAPSVSFRGLLQRRPIGGTEGLKVLDTAERKDGRLFVLTGAGTPSEIMAIDPSLAVRDVGFASIRFAPEDEVQDLVCDPTGVLFVLLRRYGIHPILRRYDGASGREKGEFLRLPLEAIDRPGDGSWSMTSGCVAVDSEGNIVAACGVRFVAYNRTTETARTREGRGMMGRRVESTPTVASVRARIALFSVGDDRIGERSFVGTYMDREIAVDREGTMVSEAHREEGYRIRQLLTDGDRRSWVIARDEAADFLLCVETSGQVVPPSLSEKSAGRIKTELYLDSRRLQLAGGKPALWFAALEGEGNLIVSAAAEELVFCSFDRESGRLRERNLAVIPPVDGTAVSIHLLSTGSSRMLASVVLRSVGGVDQQVLIAIEVGPFALDTGFAAGGSLVLDPSVWPFLSATMGSDGMVHLLSVETGSDSVERIFLTDIVP